MRRSDEVRKRLLSMANPKNVTSMARYGIQTDDALGVSMSSLRKMARDLGRSHELAQALWAEGIHEGRILAALIDEPARVTKGQMERWVADFDSWDVCDQVCMNLFDKTPYAYEKALAWSARRAEFVKRAGFALMACLAVHDKRAKDDQFTGFLEAIVRQSADERNFVKKAVNWALRQIGKRSPGLNGVAISAAERMGEIDSAAARWIARDALRELTSDKVRERIEARDRKESR